MAIPGALLLPRTANGSYVYDSGTAASTRSTTRAGSRPRARDVAIADPIINDGRAHNFGFTTEIHYFFQYRGGESLDLQRRRRRLDLRQPPSGAGSRRAAHAHGAHAGPSIRTPPRLGLTVGGLYEIALFHAERHSAGSNFKLTLTGFSPTSSTCASACGDGMVAAATEECDDGNRVSGDGCSSDCRHEIIVDYPGDVTTRRSSSPRR